MLSSPFDQFLGTNYEPTDAAFAQLQVIITSAAPELLRMDAIIDETSRALTEIRAKREAYALVDAHRALLSPIRRIPDDILHTIFMACLPRDHNAVMLTTHAPILLTLICRRWRSLALNMPLLWSSIHIPIHRFPILSIGPPWSHDDSTEGRERHDSHVVQWGIKLEGRKQLITSWLTRAKASNLSITIHQCYPWLDMAIPIDINIPEGVRDIIDLIRSYASQWEKLEVEAIHSVATMLLSLSASEVPRLQHITLSCGPIMLRQPVWPPNVFPIGPNWGPPLGLLNPSAVTSPAPPPLPQITPTPPKLEATFPPGSLITTPNLRTLLLRITPEDILTTPVKWESLTTLSCGRYSGSHINREPLSFDSKAAATILGRCSNLRQCSLVIGDVFQSLWPTGQLPHIEGPTRRIRLAHLHLLDIYEITARPLITFAQSLDLPAIRSIRVATTIPPRNVIGSTLVALLRNWGHRVEALEFDYRSLTNEQLQECLELAHNVKELAMNIRDSADSNHYIDSFFNPTIRDPPVDDREMIPRPAKLGNEFLSRLTPRVETNGGDSVLCPSLESFVVRTTAGDLTEETLVEFIRARRHIQVGEKGISKIKKVKLRFDTDVLCYDHMHPRARGMHNFDHGYVEDTTEKESWPPLEMLRQDVSVDLEGLDADIMFPQPKKANVVPDESWSAFAGINSKMYEGHFGDIRRLS